MYMYIIRTVRHVAWVVQMSVDTCTVTDWCVFCVYLCRHIYVCVYSSEQIYRMCVCVYVCDRTTHGNMGLYEMCRADIHVM